MRPCTTALWLSISSVIPVLANAQPRPRPTVSASTDGAEVFVSFSGLRGGADDWLAVAPVGSSARQWSTWRYTGGITEGTLALPAVPAGRYVARAYFGDSSYVVRAESAPFRVVDGVATGCSDRADATLEARADGGTVFVHFSSMCGAAQDWITIASADGPSNSYAAWAYTGGARQGSRSFEGLPPGRYVARAYFDWSGTQSYQVRGQSQPFWIAPEGCVCGAAASAGR